MPKIMPTWFLIGMMFFFCGIILFLTGLGERAHPPNPTPLHFSLHSAIRWGGFMGIAGAAYAIRDRIQETMPKLRTLRYE